MTAKEMDKNIKIFITIIALIIVTVLFLDLYQVHLGKEPKIKAYNVEETLEVEIVELYSTSNNYYALVDHPKYHEIIEISEDEYNLWERGDTITIGVEFTYYE